MEKVKTGIQNTLDELFTLESVLKLTKDACLERECTSIYYNIPDENKKLLSEERNHYINMLTIALDKLTKLKQITSNVEYETFRIKM